VIVNEYKGRIPFYHVDLYRINEAEVEDLGLEDLQSAQSIVVVEWADRLPYRFNGATEVFFEDLGEENRRLTLKQSSLE
jgi:tRNA threonylcarbamoyladenosine biosynthesis protein TsaE